MDAESQAFNDWVNRKPAQEDRAAEIARIRQITARDLQDATTQMDAVRAELARFLREIGRWE